MFLGGAKRKRKKKKGRLKNRGGGFEWFKNRWNDRATDRHDGSTERAILDSLPASCGGSAFSVTVIGGLRGLAAWQAGWLMADGPGSTTDECFPLSFSEQANVCHIHRFSHMGRQQCETFVKCRPQMRSTNSARQSASQREWILLAG